MNPVPRRAAWAAQVRRAGLPWAGFAAPAPNPGVLREPRPAWVEVLEVPRSHPDAEGDVELLLLDEQIRVSDREERYFREVSRPVTAAGVETSGAIEVEFDPSFETLVFHEVRILREGEPIDALARDEVRLIQPELEWADRLYSGRMKALLFLSDLRRGDLIDLSYSLRGTNPVLAGHFADEVWMGQDAPVSRAHLRVLWPANRTLRWKAFGPVPPPVVRDGGDVREYRWDLANVPGTVVEEDVPSWYVGYPLLQLSEFESWDTLVRWSLPLYETTELSPAIEQQLAAWRELPEEEAFIAAASFVQDEIRYLGIEMGPRSYAPHPVAQVFDQRFGDCKDKSRLLATLLRALGIEAWPAMVSTRLRHTLGDWLPSPYDFDHVIVYAKVSGEPLWFDPTTPEARVETSALWLNPPQYGLALVLKPGSTTLERIPLSPDERPAIEVVQTFYAGDPEAPVRLRVERIFRGGEAEVVRQELQETGVEALAQNQLDLLSASFPGTREDEALEAVDHPESGALVVTASYVLPDFWKNGHAVLEASTLRRVLPASVPTKRATPVAVEHPLRVREVIVAHLPHRPAQPARQGQVKGPALHFRHTLMSEGQTLQLELDYRSLADAVVPADLPRHLESLASASKELRLDVGLQDPPLAPFFFSLFTGTLGLALGLGVGVTLGRRRGTRREAAPAPVDRP